MAGFVALVASLGLRLRAAVLGNVPLLTAYIRICGCLSVLPLSAVRGR